MTPKTAGCCTKCDKPVFDVVAYDTKTQKPTRMGAAHDNAMRTTFMLLNGSRMDLTFCADCESKLTAADYPGLWRRVMVSWIAEDPAHPWPKSQVNNGIAARLASKPFREVA